MSKKLELGRYSDEELVEITAGDAHGGGTPSVVLSVISGYVSTQTCPTTACTDEC